MRTFVKRGAVLAACFAGAACLVVAAGSRGLPVDEKPMMLMLVLGVLFAALGTLAGWLDARDRRALKAREPLMMEDPRVRQDRNHGTH